MRTNEEIAETVSHECWNEPTEDLRSIFLTALNEATEPRDKENQKLLEHLNEIINFCYFSVDDIKGCTDCGHEDPQHATACTVKAAQDFLEGLK